MHGAMFFHIPCKEMKTVIFFDGTLTDPTSRLRLMGFDCLQQRKLQEMHKKKTSTEFTSTAQLGIILSLAADPISSSLVQRIQSGKFVEMRGFPKKCDFLLKLRGEEKTL